MERIDKPWGYEELLELNDFYVVKRLFMKEGHCCSLQYHKEKHETIYVLSGILKLIIGNAPDKLETIYCNTGEFIDIAPNIIHRMCGKTDCLYLESSTIQLDDVVRIEDDYGRS